VTVDEERVLRQGWTEIKLWRIAVWYVFLIYIKTGLYSLYYQRSQHTLHHNSFIKTWKSRTTANYR